LSKEFLDEEGKEAAHADHEGIIPCVWRKCFGKRHGQGDGRQRYIELDTVKGIVEEKENDDAHDENGQASFYRAHVFSVGKYGMGGVLVFAEPYTYGFGQTIAENADKDLDIQQSQHMVMVIEDDRRVHDKIAYQHLGCIPEQGVRPVFRPVEGAKGDRYRFDPATNGFDKDHKTEESEYGLIDQSD